MINSVREGDRQEKRSFGTRRKSRGRRKAESEKKDPNLDSVRISPKVHEGEERGKGREKEEEEERRKAYDEVGRCHGWFLRDGHSRALNVIRHRRSARHEIN